MSQLRLKALHYFNTAARHLSFKAAAAELDITPAAVSHQIKMLEADLKSPLFRRGVRQVSLTATGRLLRQTTEPSFRQLEEAVRILGAQSARESISVMLGPFISGHWLAPRLGQFLSANPGIDVELRHSTVARLPPPGGVDLAIVFGEGRWPGYVTERLLEIEVAPICTPAICSETLQALADTAGAGPALIHYKNREGWRDWLHEAGCPDHWAERGIVLDDPNVVVETAATGNGVALGAFPLIEPEIASNRLTVPHPIRVKSPQGYYIVRLEKADNDPNVVIFLEWLRTIR